MKKFLLIIALAGFGNIQAQFRIIGDPYLNQSISGITLGVHNESFSLNSSANIGQWNGANRLSTRDVLSFSELDKELLRIQFRRKNLKVGYHAHLNSYQSTKLDSKLFNMLYGSGEESNEYTYAYYGRSTFTHSFSFLKQLNKRTKVFSFLNFHNLNSFYTFQGEGYNSFNAEAPQIELNRSFTSINVPHLEKGLKLYSLPTNLSSHDSVHITKVLSLPSSISISLALQTQPTEYSRVNLFVNNLGPSAGIFSQTKYSKITLNQSATNINRNSLFSSDTIDLNSVGILDSSFVQAEQRSQVKLRPRSIGGSFEIDYNPYLTFGVGVQSIRLPDFNQFNSVLYSKWKIFDNGEILSGLQFQNVANKTLANLAIGVSFNPTEEIQIIANTSTGINYAFYNSELVPRTFSRINYTVTAQITLP